jgi:hypothetical protein
MACRNYCCIYDLESGRLPNPDQNVTAGVPGVKTTEYILPPPPNFELQCHLP